MHTYQTLSDKQILTYLNDKQKPVICVDTIDSTNTALKQMAAKGAKTGTLLCAKEQTGGKGRLGKQFFSPRQSGIYFSLLLRPAIPPKEAVFLTVSAAVAVRRALRSLLSLDTTIKWVNDIYHDNKKLCGILTESAIDAKSGAISYAILGIGLNLFTPSSGFPAEFAMRTTSLFDAAGALPDDITNRLIAEIVNQFDTLYQPLKKSDFLPEYRAASCLIGKEIEILSGKHQGSAFATAIDDDANLVVRLAGGKTISLNSGDVSIRL